MLEMGSAFCIISRRRREKSLARPSSYPTEDGLNFTTKPGLAMNVFGWENERMIVHRLGRKEGSFPRINLMLIQNVKKRWH